MSKKVTLLSLTGLAPDQLADVLVENPRAYMAVKGAVAEKHLELLLAGLRERGAVASFRRGEGDFEKDFYVQLSKSDRPLAVECKNVQVISITSVGIIANYLNFLIQTKRISPLTTAAKDMTRGEFVKCFKALPIELRESGISRYEFSAMELSKGVTLKAGGPPDIWTNLISLPYRSTFSAPETHAISRMAATKGGNAIIPTKKWTLLLRAFLQEH